MNWWYVGLVSMALGFFSACGDTASTTDDGGSTTGEDRATTIAGLTGDAAAGEGIYTQNCQSCHGADGAGVTGLGDPLTTSTLTEAQVVDVILNGRGTMTGYASVLDDQQVADVTAYTMAFRP